MSRLSMAAPIRLDAGWATVRPGLSAATLGVWAIILVGTLFRVGVSWAVGLGFGESYHVSCALRPNWSYFDHPPLAMLMGSLGIHLAGVGPLAVRLPFVVMFIGTTWLLYRITSQLYNERAGFFAVLMLNLSAVFTLSVSTFLQPDGPLMFFWLACVHGLLQVFLPEPTLDARGRPQAPAGALRWWAWIGLNLGLAMLSKYHAILLLVGAGLFALTTPSRRFWVFHPGPYLALTLAMLIFSPVLIWNAQHGWVSILWQGNRGLTGSGLRIDWLIRNIGGQALWLLPWIWFPLLLELPKRFRAGPSRPADWLVAWLAAPPILLFTLVSAYAPIGFHFHWQAPGYLILFASFGQTIDHRLTARGTWTRRWLGITAFTSVVGLLFVTTHAANGWWRAVGPQWLSAKMGESDDPLIEVLDYHTLPAFLREKGLLHRPKTFVFTNRWFQSGKVDYALAGSMPVLCLSPNDPRGYGAWSKPEDWLGHDAILISTKKFLADGASMYGSFFESAEPIGEVPVPRGRWVDETLQVTLFKNMQKPYPFPHW